MSKRKIIIISSVLLFITLLNVVVFGFVFRLKNQEVVVLGDSMIAISKKEIIETAGIDKGCSTLMINKQKALDKLEERYPYVKAVQIRTTGAQSIEIVIKVRSEMFYMEFENNYYIFDEEMKVLNIISKSENVGYAPHNLIELNPEDFNVSMSVMICDVVGTKTQQSTMKDLYDSMVTVVTKTVDGEEVYLNRNDVGKTLKKVEYNKQHKTYNKIIIETYDGVKLDIEAPEKDLQYKINVCFSTIKKFKQDDALKQEEEKENKHTKGEIKIYYNLDDELQCVYIPA